MAVAAASLAAPAWAGDPVDTTVAKPGGEFDTSISANIPKGKTKSYRLRTRNPTGSQIAATLDGDPGNHTKVKWFDGPQNITAQVKGDAYDFDLARRRDQDVPHAGHAAEQAARLRQSSGNGAGGRERGDHLRQPEAEHGLPALSEWREPGRSPQD